MLRHHLRIMEIRPPRADESQAVHDLRMLGLKETPEAFGSTYEESLTITPESIQTRYLPRADCITLCAFEDGEPTGMITLLTNDRIKTKHNASITGMYVSPQHRRKGIARRLMEAAIDHARTLPDVEQVGLEVVTSCEPAVNLYRVAGFQSFGVAPRALKQNGNYYDIDLMRLELRSGEDR